MYTKCLNDLDTNSCPGSDTTPTNSKLASDGMVIYANWSLYTGPISKCVVTYTCIDHDVNANIKLRESQIANARK